MNLEKISALLDEADVDYVESGGNLVVVLPGERRLKTNCLFIPQDGMFRVEAFVCRAVEEAQEEVYRLLLQANRKTYGVHYTLDGNNDIYLVGQFGESTTAEDVQRILGQVLERADGDFNRILERGFESSIRHEWAWRLSRGEPTFNLGAFQRLRPSQEEIDQLAPMPEKTPTEVVAEQAGKEPDAEERAAKNRAAEAEQEGEAE